VKYLIERRPRERGSVFSIHPRLSMHPLFIRRGTSDLQVFDQIFVECEYRCLDDLTQVDLIIDCGANVGYSSAYFLSRFPNSRIVAVEPDPENFAMLSRNLAPYGRRVNLVHAGIWSHATRLGFVDEPYRDGREWTKQVRVAEPGDKAHIDGVDIETLLLSSGQDRISILKVDVEGAEVEIFSGNNLSWLDKVDAIAIELHDDSVFGNATEVFFAAIEGRGFHLSRSGELTICHKRS
jgi:FkbM family methyltransferase